MKDLSSEERSLVNEESSALVRSLLKREGDDDHGGLVGGNTLN